MPGEAMEAVVAVSSADDMDLETYELPDWSRTLCGYHERFVSPFVLSIDGDPARVTKSSRDSRDEWGVTHRNNGYEEAERGQRLRGQRRLHITQAVVASPAHSAEAKSTADGLCTGATVWDAGIILSAYLHRPRLERYRGGTCIDLGSGTGIVGLAAAATGRFARVLLSDLPSVSPLLDANIRQNREMLQGEVCVAPLRWEDAQAVRALKASHAPFDLILGGDLLYRVQARVLHPILFLCSQK